MRASKLRAGLFGLSGIGVALLASSVAQAEGPWDANPGAPRWVDSHGRTLQPACPRGDRGPHEARCFMNYIVSDGKGTGQPMPLDGNKLPAIYNSPSAASSGPIVALIDAFGDDTVVADVQEYRSYNSLPTIAKCEGLPKAGGPPCIAVVDETGGPPPPAAKTAAGIGWAGETALDTEMVSAMCPECSILLVEATDQTNAMFDQAVDYAASVPGVVAISNSYGWPENLSQVFMASDNPHYNHPGILITAASGDADYDTQGETGTASAFPSSSQYVLGVGGTTLSPDTSSRGWSEVAWNDGLTMASAKSAPAAEGGGSGCSLNFPQPSFQSGLTGSCTKRASADVSAMADYIEAPTDSQATGGGMLVICTRCVSATNKQVKGFGAQGTSIASPIVAALFAHLGLASKVAGNTGWVYSHMVSFNDITSGTNDPSGKCTDSVLCNAGKGWDGPTGVGTPNGSALVSGGSAGGDGGARADGGDGSGGVIVHPIVEGGTTGDSGGGGGGGCRIGASSTSPFGAFGLSLGALAFARRRRSRS